MRAVANGALVLADVTCPIRLYDMTSCALCRYVYLSRLVTTIVDRFTRLVSVREVVRGSPQNVKTVARFSTHARRGSPFSALRVTSKSCVDVDSVDRMLSIIPSRTALCNRASIAGINGRERWLQLWRSNVQLKATTRDSVHTCSLKRSHERVRICRMSNCEKFRWEVDLTISRDCNRASSCQEDDLTIKSSSWNFEEHSWSSPDRVITYITRRYCIRRNFILFCYHFDIITKRRNIRVLFFFVFVYLRL